MLRVESKKVSNKIVSFNVQEIYMYLCVNIALEILNIYTNKVVKAIVRYGDIYVILHIRKHEDETDCVCPYGNHELICQRKKPAMFTT